MKEFIYKCIYLLALCIRWIIIGTSALLLFTGIAAFSVFVIVPIITVGALLGGNDD
jgi:hypothetical protein